MYTDVKDPYLEDLVKNSDEREKISIPFVLLQIIILVVLIGGLPIFALVLLPGRT